MAAQPFDFSAPLPLPTVAEDIAARLAAAVEGVGTSLTIVTGRPITVTAGDAMRVPSGIFGRTHLAVELFHGDLRCWLVLDAAPTLRLADLFFGGAGAADESGREPVELEQRVVGQRLAEAARCLLTDVHGVDGTWLLGKVAPVKEHTLPTSVLRLAANLAFPDGDPEPLLIALPLPEPATPADAPADGVSAVEALAGVRLPLQATVGRVVLSASDMAHLAEGDVLTLSHPVEAPVTVAVSGRPVFAASLAARRGRLALLVTDVAEGATA